MPRINIEDKFFNDPRIEAFASKIGDKHKAWGILLGLFRLAQNYYREKTAIPADIIEMGFPVKELLECRLIDKNDTGYYVKGSKDAFYWIDQRIEAGRLGGLKGGITRAKTAKRNPLGQLLPEQAQSTALVYPEQTQSKTKQTQPSISISISSSKEEVLPDGNRGKASEPFKVISTYKTEFNKTYGEDPTIDKKHFAIAKTIINLAGGLPQAIELVKKYFTIKDEWLRDNAYPLEHFIKYFNKIKVYGKTKEEDPFAKYKEAFNHDNKP